MGKSLTLGKSSSKDGVASDALQSKLELLAQSKEIVLLQKLLGTSANLHIVGGSIRELARECAATDLDLATVLQPAQVISKLENDKTIKIIPTGIGHGTLTALINGRPIEITTFRKPGSRSENNFSADILTDLSGRDFTCNALAFDLNSSTLLDPYAGQADIANGILRAVESAQTRFQEDPLRMLRMVRFGPPFGWSLGPDLVTSARAMAEQLKTVSIERIRSEFEKILVRQNVAASMRLLVETNLLEQFIPEMLPSVGFEQNDFHIHDVFEHTLWVMERAPAELTLRLAAFFHDIGKPESLTIDEAGRRHFYDHEKFSSKICKRVMERMRFSSALTERVCLLVALHMKPLVCSDKTVRRLIRDLGPAMEQWKQLKQADKTPKQDDSVLAAELLEFENKLAKEDQRLFQSQRSGLIVDGQDLIKTLGLKPGPDLGRVLKGLEEAILDDPTLNNRQDLLALAKRMV